MVFFIPALLGHMARVGITATTARSAAGTFANSLPFGAGYSFGTYVGFPGNYKRKSRYSKNRMYYASRRNYGRRYRRYRKSYSRYPKYYSRRYY